MPYKYNPFTGNLDIYGSSLDPTDLELTFHTDDGDAESVDRLINVVGDAVQGITTSGATDTVTITALDASDVQKGVVRLATDSETITGIDATVANTPASLAAKLGIQTLHAMPYGNGLSGAIDWTSSLLDGEIVIGSTSGAPAAANITSTGGTVIVTNGANTINLEASGTHTPIWMDQATSTTMVKNNNYFATDAITLTLPAVVLQGDTISVDVDTSSNVVILANTGQFIRLGTNISSVGGNIESLSQGCAVTLTYRESTLTWHGRGIQGTWTVN